MRDLISKLDALLLESTTLQDLKQHPAADDPEIQRAIADKEKQQKNNTDESMFEIGDAFGISFSEDHEIATEIVDVLEDGIVIELDDTALDMLTNEGLTFLEGELSEGRGTCWVGYEQKGMKKKGDRMVPNCVKEDEIEESGLQYYTGVKKHGEEYMKRAAEAGRKGASQEELGRLKDRYSKAEKNKPQKEDHGPENPNAPVNYGEYDREGDMAKDQLRTIDSAAEELYAILDANENLPEWVQKKITLAVDYIDTARDYMKSNKYAEGVTEGSAHGYNVAKWYEKNGDQKKLTNWLRKEAGLPKDADVYFDDADLVYGERTIVPGALVNPKLKFNDLLTAVVQATGGTAKQKVDGVYRSQGVAEDDVDEAKYRGREVPLGKKMAGDVKKSKVYVRKPNGNIVKVNFGDKKMRIKKSNPARRKSFRARHNCKNPGPRWKARYWSCRSW